jgi:hypothetical protein
MTAQIEVTDTKLEYVSIAEAKKLTGLRLILGAYPIPGPWREACKGTFHVKGIPYTRVSTADSGASDLEIGMDGTQTELVEWTAQSSAPVAIWNDELPRSSWIDQLNLAERLEPDPPLVPELLEDRVRMFGLSNEILGEDGLVWLKRLLMVDGPLKTLPADDGQCRFWRFLGDKYGYTEERAAPAAGRIARIVEAMDEQLKGQRDRGSRYLVGDRLSALDIYWATACGILSPLPPDLCPMATAFRGVYGNSDPGIAAALSAELVAHRDFIYREYLELPIVF